MQVGKTVDDIRNELIYGKAGTVQVNRRVMKKVTHLPLISDAIPRSVAVMTSIQNVRKMLRLFGI